MMYNANDRKVLKRCNSIKMNQEETKVVPYPSIETLKFKSSKDWIKNYRYYIEEKIDGSQMSFLSRDGEIAFYNKRNRIEKDNGVFYRAIMMLSRDEFVQLLNSEYIYHGEAVCNIRHNVVVYGRTPKYYFVLYDIYDMKSGKYLSLEEKHKEASRIGIECTSVLYVNDDPNKHPNGVCEDLIQQIEDNKIQSCLGGTIEGVVLKHESFISGNKEIAVKLKYVTEKFKERHTLKQDKVTRLPDAFLEWLGKSFSTTARFNKAYQHIIERQENINMDKLVRELDIDFDKEYKDEITAYLWAEFGPIIKKYAREGIGSWYKEKINDK